MPVKLDTIALVDSLTSEELEAYVGLNMAEKVSPAALEERLYCRTELIDRIETGSNNTPIAERKSDKLKLSTKLNIKSLENQFPTRIENIKNDANELFVSVKFDNEGNPTTLLTTDLFYPASAYYTRLRLAGRRANNSAKNFGRGFLGTGFVYSFLGLFGIIEFLFELFVMIKTAFFTKTRAEKNDLDRLEKLAKFKASLASSNPVEQQEIIKKEMARNANNPSAWQRFKDSFWAEGRINRMVNGIVWFLINLVSFFIKGWVGGLLNVLGACIDIGNDVFGAIRQRGIFVSLLQKLKRNKGRINPEIYKPAKKHLKAKIQHISIAGIKRLFTYNAILTVAFLFTQTAFITLFPPLLIFGLFAAITALALLDLVHFRLPSDKNTVEHKKNRIDKIRAVMVVGIMLLGLLVMVGIIFFPAPTLALATAIGWSIAAESTFLASALLTVGAAVALTVGLTGLFRAIAHAIYDDSFKWLKHKCIAIKNYFFPVPVAAPAAVPAVSVHLSIPATLPIEETVPSDRSPDQTTAFSTKADKMSQSGDEIEISYLPYKGIRPRSQSVDFPKVPSSYSLSTDSSPFSLKKTRSFSLSSSMTSLSQTGEIYRSLSPEIPDKSSNSGPPSPSRTRRDTMTNEGEGKPSSVKTVSTGPAFFEQLSTRLGSLRDHMIITPPPYHTLPVSNLKQ